MILLASFGSASFGPVTVLMLDVRFFETPATRLGEEQWRFVEKFLSEEREGEKVIVVASSIQVRLICIDDL